MDIKPILEVLVARYKLWGDEFCLNQQRGYDRIVVKCFKFIQFKLWMEIANSKPLFEYLSSTYVRDIELSILCYLNKAHSMIFVVYKLSAD